MTPSEPIPVVRLAPGRDASVHEGHPWVFSRAIASNQPIPDHGAVVHVVSADGKPLGTASYSARSDIALRFFAMNANSDGECDLSEEGLIANFTKLAAAKETLLDIPTDSYRLVHGIGDHLPGVVIDRYGDVFVLQISTATMDALRNVIVHALKEAFSPVAIVERSVLASRAAEGLTAVQGLLFGTLPEPLVIMENHAKFQVDVLTGQKTGFFLDQRTARAEVARVAKGRSLLNVFCYSGGFTIQAALGGAASSMNVDSSGSALDALRENLALNGIDQSKHATLELDVARALKSLRDKGAGYDLVVVDPPAFVKRRADLGSGTRAYIKTNAHAMRLANPDAYMLSCSCSQYVDDDHFRSMLVAAAAEAHRDIQLVKKLTQAPDHTMRPNFPEGSYLKGWLMKID